jgi:hypothetical protein
LLHDEGIGRVKRLYRDGLFLLALLLGSITPPVCAQSFGPPVPTELVLVLLDREGTVRFTLSGFYTEWQNPFRITLGPRYSTIDRRLETGHFRLLAATPVSPLLEGKYVLGRRWSLGFWYNPIRGERLRHSFEVAQRFFPLDLERDTDLADVHLIYAAARGMTAQLGYYHEGGTIRSFPVKSASPSGLPSRKDYTLVSWNLWLTQRLDVFSRGRMTSARLDAHLIPFVSLGYHASSGLNHATSVLTGVAVTFGEKISLSGSVWLFDLHHTATRITGGLVIQF